MTCSHHRDEVQARGHVEVHEGWLHVVPRQPRSVSKLQSAFPTVALDVKQRRVWLPGCLMSKLGQQIEKSTAGRNTNAGDVGNVADHPRPVLGIRKQAGRSVELAFREGVHDENLVEGRVHRRLPNPGLPPCTTGLPPRRRLPSSGPSARSRRCSAVLGGGLASTGGSLAISALVILVEGLNRFLRSFVFPGTFFSSGFGCRVGGASSSMPSLAATMRSFDGELALRRKMRARRSA